MDEQKDGNLPDGSLVRLDISIFCTPRPGRGGEIIFAHAEKAVSV